MKKMNKLATAISVSLIAASGPSVAEVTLYDYTEATSAYEDAYISGQFSASDGNQGQAGYNADLSLDFDRVYSSPNRNVSTKLQAEGSVNKGTTKGDGSTSSYLVNGSLTSDTYFRPGSKGAFWYGSVDAGVKKDAEDPFTKLGVGLGYGRVVNVTPMAKAIRVVEALREQGALKADLPKATYQQIANIIARESEYKSKYGAASYEQQWITDIEKVIMSSGLIQGNLSAGAVIKTNDVLQNEFISTRKHGWLVRAGIGAVLSNYDGTDGGDPSLDLGAEYHRPLNNRTQLSNVASLSTIYGDDDAAYQVNNALTLTHELTDKIDWENAWLLDYSKSGDSAVDDVTTNALSSTFRYYLDNQLDLTLTAKASKTDDNIADNGNDDVDTSLNMGVSYRLR